MSEKAMINLAIAEQEKLETIFSLPKEFDSEIIALTIEEERTFSKVELRLRS